MVTLEQLVPKDHLLRLLDQHIRFDFTREATQHLYCENNGRPAIDPVVLFKMLFIGYLFGIRSERRLVKEFQVNVAYRCLTDKVRDASTLSRTVVAGLSARTSNSASSMALSSKPLSTS